MAEPKSFIADPVLAKQAASPLAGHVETGEFGALRDEGPGVILSERFVCRSRRSRRGQAAIANAASPSRL